MKGAYDSLIHCKHMYTLIARPIKTQRSAVENPVKLNEDSFGTLDRKLETQRE